MRSKAEGTRLYISSHPEWSAQFVKYRTQWRALLTDDKVLLLAMVLTEGYTDPTSFGFTNTQEMLHDKFRELVTMNYGDVRIGRNRITSRVSSTEIARELAALLPQKTFHDDALRRILDSPALMVRVLRIVADTEGSILISIKRAKRNFTTDSRIVLASSNQRFTRQIGLFLDILGIGHHMSKAGAIITRKSQIARFIETVGFSPGVRVVRKKAGHSIWYGYEKAGLQNLFCRIASEQKTARAIGQRGAFADCTEKEQIILRLRTWYAQVNGGGKN